MPPSSHLWTDVTLSEHTHERAALNFIRDRFPAREPFRAWSNFTFIADDGSTNEVDLLVVSPTGVYLVEIKSSSSPGTPGAPFQLNLALQRWGLDLPGASVEGWTEWEPDGRLARWVSGAASIPYGPEWIE